MLTAGWSWRRPSELGPLCGTPVQNPRQPYDPETPKPFPSELDLFSPSDDRGYLALIATLLLALPAAICLCCDLAYTHGAGLVVVGGGGMGLLWILVVPMLLIRRGTGYGGPCFWTRLAYWAISGW